MEGYISIYRDLQKHWIWQDVNHLKWWLTILMNVNHASTKFPVNNELITCNPGESFRSIEGWTMLFGCSKKTTIKFFLLLESDNMIERKILGSGNRRKHLISVLNWLKYQRKELKTTPEGYSAIHQKVTPNNNDNNENKNRVVKNIRFSPPTLQEVKEYFSEKEYSLFAAQRAFEYYSEANWKDSTGKQVKNWKQKMIAVWFKPEYKIITDELQYKIRRLPAI